MFQRSRSVKFKFNAHIDCVLRLGLFSYAGPTSSLASPFPLLPLPLFQRFHPPLPPWVNVVRGPMPSALECLSKCSIFPFAGPTLKFGGMGGVGGGEAFSYKGPGASASARARRAGKETNSIGYNLKNIKRQIIKDIDHIKPKPCRERRRRWRHGRC